MAILTEISGLIPQPPQSNNSQLFLAPIPGDPPPSHLCELQAYKQHTDKIPTYHKTNNHIKKFQVKYLVLEETFKEAKQIKNEIDTF